TGRRRHRAPAVVGGGLPPRGPRRRAAPVGPAVVHAGLHGRSPPGPAHRAVKTARDRRLGPHVRPHRRLGHGDRDGRDAPRPRRARRVRRALLHVLRGRRPLPPRLGGRWRGVVPGRSPFEARRGPRQRARPQPRPLLAPPCLRPLPAQVGAARPPSPALWRLGPYPSAVTTGPPLELVRRAPRRTISASLRELWEALQILANMVRRDFSAKHKNSFFGMAWSLVNPLLLVAIFSFVFWF